MQSIRRPSVPLVLLLAACSGGGGGGGAPATGVVPLAAAIQAPTTAAANEFVQLDGSSSTGGVASYQWRLIDPATGQPFGAADAPVELLGTDQPVASFLAPDAALTVRVELEVGDGTATAATRVDVDVTPSLLPSGIELLTRFAPAAGDFGQARASAYDPVSGRLFTVSPFGARLDAFDLAPLAQGGAPTPSGTLAFGSGTGGPGAGLPPTAPRDVAVFASGGVSRVLVSLVRTSGSNPEQQNGFLAFVDPLTLAIDAVVDTGPRPGAVAVHLAAGAAVVADEGAPSADYALDPAGSFTVVPLGPDGLPGTPLVADFTAYDGQEAALRAQGVRLFGPGASASQDLEPQGLTVVPGTSLALGTLQENNALAIVDPVLGLVRGLLPLGTKDWSSPELPRFARATTARLATLPGIGATDAGEALRLGGFAGLHFVEETADGRLEFLALPGRGPVLRQDVDTDGADELVFALPDHQARWVRLNLDPESGALEVVEGSEVLLTRDGANSSVLPITGRPNLPAIAPGLGGNDLEPVDLTGQPLALDAFGGHFGALTVGGGKVWIADRYRGSIYRFAPDGRLEVRFVPQGTEMDSKSNVFGEQTLPQVYGRPQVEQGFAALAYDESAGVLYAWSRAPLDNPDAPDDSVGASTRLMRVLGIDPDTGAQVSQHLFLLDEADHRIADAVWSGEPGVFVLLEHNGTSGPEAVVRLERLDVTQGTNLLDLPGAVLPLVTTFAEAAIGFDPGLADDPSLAAQLGLSFARKTLLADLATRGVRQFAALEGLARIDADRYALIADDASGLADVQVAPATGALVGAVAPASETGLVLVELDPAGFDASDEDGGANFAAWPVLGLPLPEGIGAFEVDGELYLVTADEGEARDYAGFSEVARVGELAPDGQGGVDDPYPLDGGEFPDAATLELAVNLGRLEVTTVDGDPDTDGAYEQIHAFGGRSFTVWDGFGRRVFDSGDDLARWTLELDAEFYNAAVLPNTADESSAERGVEPEGLALGTVDGRPLLFLGAERSNGVFVFDLSTPSAPRFVDLLRADGDQSPDGLEFVAAADSPTGAPLLIVSYEGSGSVAIWRLAD